MNCDPKIINRVKRLQGQLNGILKMMESQSDCQDIMVQLKAVKSSINKVMSLVTTSNLLQTIEKTHKIELDDISDALNIIVKNA